MSPRTGRPPKGIMSRTEKINLRVSKIEAEKIKKCADFLGVSRVDAVMKGIELLEEKINKK